MKFKILNNIVNKTSIFPLDKGKILVFCFVYKKLRTNVCDKKYGI